MSPERPLISCIVPVFNGERFLAEALDSILDQSYQPIEVIVVDDGSSDGTAAIIARYRHRVRAVRQPNAGPAAARNQGIRLARGELIAFLDADDLWHRDKLARQMEVFDRNPAIELCLCQKENFWEAERRGEGDSLQAKGHVFATEHTAYVCQALLVRRAVFDRIGGFDRELRIGEDTDWLARAEEGGIRREIVPETLVYRRMHRANLTLSATAEDRLNVVLAKLKRERARQVSTVPESRNG